MVDVYHIPAMLKETIDGLAINANGVYVDVTFGGGGHSRAILEKLASPHPSPKGKEECSQGHLYSFDQDIEAYQAEEERAKKDDGTILYGDKHWEFVHSNFRYLRNWMDYYGVKEIDGLLADLGVSSHHFDCPERGFSFRYPAPLDMRMNKNGKRTAADIVNSYSEEELARVFWLYGELKNGRQIAKSICKARTEKAIERTEELVEVVYPHPLKGKGEDLDIPPQRKKEMAKIFQALRIEVNDELGALREMLVAAKDLLKPGGRIAILTYHSLEDRLVKNFLRSGNLKGEIEKDFYGNILTPFTLIEKGLTASDEEVERNPRSRSAKLRVAEKK